MRLVAVYDDLLALLAGVRAQVGFFSAAVFGPFSAQTDWYIDPVNGSDSNTGTAVQPLRTVTRLLQLVAPFGRWTVRSTTRVYLLNDLLSTDLVPLRVTCVGGANLFILAAANANADPSGSGLILVAAQSTLTAHTAIDRTTVGAGMPETGTSATTNWTAAVDFLFHDVSAAANTYAWVNQNAGGGVAWFTKLTTMPAIGAPLFPAPFTNAPIQAPLGNDNFTILRGIKTYFTSIVVEHQQDPANNNQGNLFLNGLWNQGLAALEWTPIDGAAGGYPGLYATLCRFDGSPVLLGSPCFENCLFKDGAQSSPGSQPIVLGGGIKRFFANTLSAGTFDGDLLITNCFPFFGNSDNLIGQIGVIGNSVHVGRTDGIGLTHIEAQFYGFGVIWGSSPLFIHAGSALLYATTAVACYTANAGFTLGAATAGPPQQLDGTYLAATTYTWAHVDAAVGAGTGFGGQVFDIASGAAVRKAV